MPNKHEKVLNLSGGPGDLNYIRMSLYSHQLWGGCQHRKFTYLQN